MAAEPRAPLLVVRTVADAGAGAGHVMRCLAIARALAERGGAVAFAVPPEALATVPRLQASGFALLDASPRPCAVVLIDGYGFSEADEAAWAAMGAVVAVLEDAPGRRHACDLLIDAAPGRVPSDYAGWTPPGARLLLGPAYAPIDPAFAALRAEALVRREAAAPLRTVFVSTGMTDVGGGARKALEALATLAAIERIDVALGAQAARAPDLQAAARTDPRVCLHPDAQNMPRLMLEADLAIGAAGVSAWERCALGLPSVVLLTADNQADNARALALTGAAKVLGPVGAVTQGAVRAAVAALGPAPARRVMARAAAALVDGEGAGRIADALLDLARRGSSLK